MEDLGDNFQREIRRGEIYYIYPRNSVGVEMAKGRPAVIVSNNQCNDNAGYVTVVYLTSKDKKLLPTHVPIPENANLPVYGTILCETVQQTSKLLLGEYIGELSEELMEKVSDCICIQCDIFSKPTRKSVEPEVIVKEVPVKDTKLEEEIENLKLELIKSQEREKIFRELYTKAVEN